jgi:hypothetical protein
MQGEHSEEAKTMNQPMMYQRILVPIQEASGWQDILGLAY